MMMNYFSHSLPQFYTTFVFLFKQHPSLISYYVRLGWIVNECPLLFCQWKMQSQEKITVVKPVPSRPFSSFSSSPKILKDCTTTSFTQITCPEESATVRRPKVTRFTPPPSDLLMGIAVAMVSSSLKFSLSFSEFGKELCVYLIVKCLSLPKNDTSNLNTNLSSIGWFYKYPGCIWSCYNNVPNFTYRIMAWMPYMSRWSSIQNG